jgi:hypothetical protein
MSLEGTAKAAATAQLAGLLGAAAANAQCTRAAWLSGEGYRRLANDSLPPSAWEGLDLASSRSPEQALQILPPQFRRLGVRVFVSDLLWPGNPAGLLRRWRDGAAALFVIQLLAREEARRPDPGNWRVVDSETGEETELYIDATAAAQYAENLANWQQAWNDACRQAGARMTTIIAEDLEQSLPELQAIELLAPA